MPEGACIRDGHPPRILNRVLPLVKAPEAYSANTARIDGEKTVDARISVRANLPLVNAYLQAGLDALGDATRMAIFQKLAGGPIAVNELARQLPVSRPAVSQHLKVLKDAGLVTDMKEGTRRLYQLDPEGVARLRAHFDQMWTRALGNFKEAAEKSATGDRHGKPGRTRTKRV
jgi:DNA-binding transcriptional ArsR family regulator